MCAKGQIVLELSLMWIQITCFLAFNMPWDRLDSTFHYPIEALYKEPFGYVEREELKSEKNIVHCCCSLLVLESASLFPLEHFVFFPSFPFLVSLLLRDGGLSWWRTQFLLFADMPTEVVTCVISDLINRNITSKWKLGNNTNCSKGTKGCRLKYKQAMTTMDYSFHALQFLSFNVSNGFPIYQSKGVMEGQIRVISRHMEGQETSGSDTHQGKLQKYFSFCTHPDVHGFKGNIHVYTWEMD